MITYLSQLHLFEFNRDCASSVILDSLDLPQISASLSNYYSVHIIQIS